MTQLLEKEPTAVGYSRRLALIAEYTPAVKRTVCRFLREYPTARHLADDLESAGSLALVIAVKRLQAGKVRNFPAFLDRTIWNQCVDVLRSEVVLKLPAKSQARRVEMQETESPRTAIDCELIDRIHAACLDETDRLIIALRATGKTQREVAEELGILQQAVSIKLIAIEERLRRDGKP